jgi:hypothetical protein
MNLLQGIQAHDPAQIQEVFQLIAQKLSSAVPRVDAKFLSGAVGDFEAKYSSKISRQVVVSTETRHAILERAHLWAGFGESYELDGGQRREWRIRVWNSGKTVGVLQEVHWAKVEPQDFKHGNIKYTPYTGREDVIPPSLGKPDERETGISFTICKPMVCCGWIVWEDVFGNTQKQGWKHTLNLKPDAAGNFSIPFPGAYSRNYRPWEEEGTQ